jgi:hypothetical protein
MRGGSWGDWSRNETAMVTLPTGSVVRVLGAPERAEPRFWDAPSDAIPRADAWFWSCGCAAEPVGPGRFTVVGCDDHRASLQRRYERKTRTFSTYGPVTRKKTG